MTYRCNRCRKTFSETRTLGEGVNEAIVSPCCLTDNFDEVPEETARKGKIVQNWGIFNPKPKSVTVIHKFSGDYPDRGPGNYGC